MRPWIYFATDRAAGADNLFRLRFIKTQYVDVIATGILSLTTLNVQFADGRSHAVVFDQLEQLPTQMAARGLGPGPCVIVTDDNVAGLYLERLGTTLDQAGYSTSTFSVRPGESSKSLRVLEELYDTALGARVDRATPVIALGGGVVGDLAGLGAATLLRGVPLVHVPTTLVAQIDSSIGGKTGVNHAAGKNLIGSFYQPRLVLTDIDVLQSLDDREWRSGLAEMVKHAMLDSHEHTTTVLSYWEQIVARKADTLRIVVPRSAAFKASIVADDEMEHSRRAVLNLGHTVGHAIERAAGYGELSHGESVAAGLAVALRISDMKYPRQDRGLAWDLLHRLGWPSTRHLDVRDIMDGLATDKKVLSGIQRFILLPAPGSPEISTTVSIQDIEAAYDWLIRPKSTGD
ncbi:MAG: 3-dehydroquinate synthase [Rhodothermales bacterium]|nr:3-dehydroquinate synthase [Rhodothermales bacterium]